MTTTVEKTVEVDVPVRTAYDQWTQFEEFPRFMGGVKEVRQLNDTTLHWVAEIAGVEREWDAAIVQQVPDRKIAWTATSGATNAGAVEFQPLGASRTAVRLTLEYQPEGLVEKVGDFLNIVSRRAEADLAKFKEFIESRGAKTGEWRGSVNAAAPVGTPGVDDAPAAGDQKHADEHVLHLQDPRTEHLHEVARENDPPDRTLHLQDRRTEEVDHITAPHRVD